MGWRLPLGTLDPIYAKVAEDAGVTDGRDELARRTKIPATNLSSINRGKRDMTASYAHRIAAAAEISPVELGAPAKEDDPVGQSIFARLEELEEGFVALGAQLARLEHPDAVQEIPAPPKTKRSGSRRGKSKR